MSVTDLARQEFATSMKWVQSLSWKNCPLSLRNRNGRFFRSSSPVGSVAGSMFAGRITDDCCRTSSFVCRPSFVVNPGNSGPAMSEVVVLGE